MATMTNGLRLRRLEVLVAAMADELTAEQSLRVSDALVGWESRVDPRGQVDWSALDEPGAALPDPERVKVHYRDATHGPACRERRARSMTEAHQAVTCIRCRAILGIRPRPTR